jgi:hypothetical protein
VKRPHRALSRDHGCALRSLSAAWRWHRIQRRRCKLRRRLGGPRLCQPGVLRFRVERRKWLRRVSHRGCGLEDQARQPPDLFDELLVECVLAATCTSRRNDTVELIEQGANESRMPSKLGGPGRGRPAHWICAHGWLAMFEQAAGQFYEPMIGLDAGGRRRIDVSDRSQAARLLAESQSGSR